MSDQPICASSARQQEVEYKPVVGFPGYRVGDDGSVWSCLKIGNRGGIGSQWRKLTPIVNRKRKGYLHVALRRDGRNITLSIHRIVLESFVGPRPDGMECRHKNGNKTDNCLADLEWGTPHQNAADKKNHGTHFVGEDCSAAKLTALDVAEIRRLYASGIFSQSKIASMFGVTQSPISLIIRRKTWRHV